MQRWMVGAALLGALASAGWADTRTIRPRYARPEDIETIVSRVVPNAGVAAVKAQNSVLLSGTDEVLEQAESVIRELDQPGQVVELEIGMTGSTSSVATNRGVGFGFKGGRAQANPATPPSEALTQRGNSSDAAVQSLVAMPGRPAEVTIGDAIVIPGGPAAPPTQVQTGKRVAIDGLRVIEDGKGAEMDVVVDDTVPGAGPVVSSGTHAKTSVRLMIGQTQTIAESTSDSDADASTAGGSAPGNRTASGQVQRTRATKVTAGQVTITLRGIR